MRPASRAPSAQLERRLFRKRHAAAPVNDEIKMKKVKFADSASIQELDCRQDTSLCTIDGAKTFELKSVKKLREETCHKLYSHQVSNQDRKLKTHESSEILEAFNNTSTCNYKTNHSSPPILKGTPFLQRSFHSPSKVLQNHELEDKITCNFEAGDSSLSNRNVLLDVQRSFPSPALASCNCEEEWEHSGIFSKKRAHLIHLAAKASSLQVNEFLSKRSELIPKFMERLTTMKISSDGNVVRKPVQRNSNGGYHLHTTSESDDLLENLREASEMGFTAVAVQNNLGSEFLDHNCEDVDDPILPAWALAKTYASPFLSSSGTCRLLTSSKFDDNFKDNSREIIVTGLSSTIPSRYTGNKLLTDNQKNTDEFILSAMDSFDDLNFPSWHDLETTLQCNRGPSTFLLGSRELSDLDSDYESVSALKLEKEFGFGKYGCRAMDRLLTGLNFIGHDKSPSYCHYTEQALVPYKKTSSMDSFDFSGPGFPQSASEQCARPLLGWSTDIEEEKELFVSSDTEVPAELDHLPLALYSSTNFLDQRKSYDFIDGWEKGNEFRSPLCSRCNTTDRCTPCQNLEDAFKTKAWLATRVEEFTF